MNIYIYIYNCIYIYINIYSDVSGWLRRGLTMIVKSLLTYWMFINKTKHALSIMYVLGSSSAPVVPLFVFPLSRYGS